MSPGPASSHSADKANTPSDRFLQVPPVLVEVFCQIAHLSQVNMLGLRGEASQLKVFNHLLSQLAHFTISFETDIRPLMQTIQRKIVKRLCVTEKVRRD
jgi:hypothetical protein